MPDKYQDEIEEILRRAGEATPSQPSQDGEGDRRRDVDRGPSPVRASREVPSTGPSNQRRWPRLSPGKLLLAGFVVFVMGALLGWTPGIWIGLGMVVVAYMLFFVTPRSKSHEKRWRGRSVDEAPSSPWDRLKNWLKSG